MRSYTATTLRTTARLTLALACLTLPIGCGASAAGDDTTTDDEAVGMSAAPITRADAAEGPRYFPTVEAALERARQPKATPVGNLAPGASGGPDNGITYHGGPILYYGATDVYFIWYGNWSATDKQVLTDLVPGLSESPYWYTNTTYYDSNGNHPYRGLRLAGTTSDSYSHGTNLSDSDVQAIVSTAISNNSLPTDYEAVYFVLSSPDVNQHNNANTAAFCTKYCGWHNQATISSTAIKYSWIGNAATKCPGSCGVHATSPNGTPGPDAMASVFAHELEEAVTDPDVSSGWWEQVGVNGEENADLCAWTFGSTYTTGNGGTANMKLGSRDYLIQRNWVNQGGGYCGNFVRRPGDIDGDGRADIVATGGSSFTGVPIASSNGDGTFVISNLNSTFNSFSSQAGAKTLTGDFNGDGKTDLLSTGVSWWSSLPVAFSSGNGSFNITNLSSTFNSFSSQAGAKVLSGDFNGDGKTDLVATGVSWWGSLPVASSNGDGTFSVTNLSSTFNSFSSQAGVKLVTGDFNGDGWADIAATGGSGWNAIVVAFSNGNGTFTVTNLSSLFNTFNNYSSVAGAQVFAGDFDGDGLTDLIATGVAGWSSLPIAFSNGDGTFRVYNMSNDFNAYSSQAGAKVVVGDFDGDSKDDLAATGVSWWSTLPVTFSNGDGTFTTTNKANAFSNYSSVSGAKVLSSWY